MTVRQIRRNGRMVELRVGVEPEDGADTEVVDQRTRALCSELRELGLASAIHPVSADEQPSNAKSGTSGVWTELILGIGSSTVLAALIQTIFSYATRARGVRI